LHSGYDSGILLHRPADAPPPKFNSSLLDRLEGWMELRRGEHERLPTRKSISNAISRLVDDIAGTIVGQQNGATGRPRKIGVPTRAPNSSRVTAGAVVLTLKLY
jgi:hypothetical protein